MQRFYMFHSFTRFHRNAIAAASLFLAAKVTFLQFMGSNLFSGSGPTCFWASGIRIHYSEVPKDPDPSLIKKE
jgi:hypothetical protein